MKHSGMLFSSPYPTPSLVLHRLDLEVAQFPIPSLELKGAEGVLTYQGFA